ncbi:MAG: S41 family peptidase, partial [Planctomycetota bacterium]
GLAKLIGTPTYGKGSIQQLFDIENNRSSYMRLTIGRYFLPSGKSIHINRDKMGMKPKDESGGLQPDYQIENKEIDYWIIAEKEKLSQNQKLLEYVDNITTRKTELAKKLAFNDNRSYKNYPGFNALYKSLKTKLNKNDVREILRYELRRKIMDIIGKEMVYDIADDTLLAKTFDIISQDISLNKEELGVVNKELPVQEGAKIDLQFKQETKTLPR